MAGADPVNIRRAQKPDGAAIAGIVLAARKAALPTVRWLHDEAEVRRWVSEDLFEQTELLVAVADGEVVGMMALEPGWIAQLYVRPDRQRMGLGAAFVSLAKAAHPGGLRLYTFQINHAARRFYETHGFVATTFSDGTGNEEQEPDILYEWTPCCH